MVKNLYIIDNVIQICNGVCNNKTQNNNYLNNKFNNPLRSLCIKYML